MQTTYTVSVPEAAGGVSQADGRTREVSAIPYIAKAAGGELRGILQSAFGVDPTAEKSPADPGQNTKNNIAISLLRLRAMLRGVYSVRYTFEPYGSDPAVSELCVYVKRFLCSREECIRTGILRNDKTRTVTTIDGTGAMGIGYNYNFSFDTFSAADDPWQRNFGFCKLYDRAAILIGDRYETVRVTFRYGGRDWMIQIWKGIYSWNMLGGEIGIYNKPIDRKADFYDCAADSDRLKMAFSVSLGDETIVQTEPAYTWWQTMFTVHKHAKPSSLTMQFSIAFPNTQMLNAFLYSLTEAYPNVRVQRQGLTLHCCWPAA